MEDEGGWPKREISDHFAAYADAVSKRMGDRVTHWMTINEPLVISFAGYRDGIHAPGLKDRKKAFQTAYHLCLAHGKAYQAIKANHPQAKVGITNVSWNPLCFSRDEQTANLVEYAHAENNRIFLDPLLRRTYPQIVLDRLGGEAPEIRDEDLKIANQVDFLGVQYYADKILHSENTHWGIESPRVPFFEYTEMGWPVTPVGLYEHLMMLTTDYEAKDIFITENGSAWQDVLDPDGRIRDEKRQKYLVDHLLQVHRAIEDGVPVKGYFAWSFMDNFEWAYGYRPRFGLIYTEYASQKRYIKDSGFLYRDIIAANGLEPEGGIPLPPNGGG